MGVCVHLCAHLTEQWCLELKIRLLYYSLYPHLHFYIIYDDNSHCYKAKTQDNDDNKYCFILSLIVKTNIYDKIDIKQFYFICEKLQ